MSIQLVNKDQLPLATSTNLGIVKPDGSTIQIDSNGTLSVPSSVVSMLSNWSVNTVIGQTEYTLGTNLPSSTSSDYLVFYGSSLLLNTNYVINKTTGVITLNTAPTEVNKLFVCYWGNRVYGVNSAVISNDISSESTITVPSSQALSTVYNTLTTLINNQSPYSAQNTEALVSLLMSIGRTGKVYTTKVLIYDDAEHSSSAGTKLDDNAGLICQPFTDVNDTTLTDDYINIPLFKWYNCNYVRDNDGTARVTAVEGQSSYKTSGSVDVGVLGMSFYYKVEIVEETDGSRYQLWSITDTARDGYVIWPECKKSDGSTLPYYIHSKYFSGDVNGVPRSQPNLQPIYDQSYSSTITNYQKKGAGYWGAGITRQLFALLFLIIKYGTKNTQTIFQGCSSHSYDSTISVAEANTKRLIVPYTTNNINNFYVNSAVTYGSNRSAVSYKVLSQEILVINNTQYLALNINNSEGLTTTVNTKVTTMPCWSGQTDLVYGHHDGSYMSNTNGKHTCRIQGTEYMPGLCCCISDTVWNTESGTYTKTVYHAEKGTAHTTNTSTIMGSYTPVTGVLSYLTSASNHYIGDMNVSTGSGLMWPITKSTSDSLGTGDYCWIDSGWNEWVMGGNLAHSSYCGFCFLSGCHSLSYSYWNFGSAD